MEIKPLQHIVYVHQDGLITGSAISLRNMILALDKKRFKATVLLPQNGPAIDMWKQAGADVCLFPFTTFWTSPGPTCLSRENLNQWKSFWPSQKLKKYILNLKPHLIHINDKACLQVGVSLQGAKIPIVQHSRSALHLTACKLNKWMSVQAIKRYANHVICISEDEEQGFEKMSNHTIMYNTVDLQKADQAVEERMELRHQLGFADQEIVLGMAENMGIRKGLLELIDIMESLKHWMGNPVKILIVGKLDEEDNIRKFNGFDGSSKQFLMNYLHSSGWIVHTKLVGFVPNALSYIACMDAILISKAHGVLGRQPIEAQSVGAAVIAVNGHSRRSTLVAHGVAGYLVSNLEELITILNKLLETPKTLNEMGEFGRRFAYEHFDLHKYMRKMETIYSSLLS